MKAKYLLFLPILSFSILAGAQGVWSPRTNFPGNARTCPASFSIANKAYIGTGGDLGSIYSDFWEYDVSTDTWTQKLISEVLPACMQLDFQLALTDIWGWAEMKLIHLLLWPTAISGNTIH